MKRNSEPEPGSGGGHRAQSGQLPTSFLSDSRELQRTLAASIEALERQLDERDAERRSERPARPPDRPSNAPPAATGHPAALAGPSGAQPGDRPEHPRQPAGSRPSPALPRLAFAEVPDDEAWLSFRPLPSGEEIRAPKPTDPDQPG